MALSTYSDLQTAVANWLHRDGMTTIIPDLITLGEKRIFSELRVRDMETSLSETISSGVVAVPADYLELKFAYIDGTPVQHLQKASASFVYTKYPYRVSDTKPLVIARDAGNFIFGPFPDSSYTVKGVYYAKPTGIATSATFFALYPDLFLFSALCEAAPYIGNDARIPIWEQKYQMALSRANKQDDSENSSGGGMQVVPA